MNKEFHNLGKTISSQPKTGAQRPEWRKTR